MKTVQKILVPTDFSPHADEAFRVAHTLAGATGAEVVVFHVIFHVTYSPAVAAEGGLPLAEPGDGKMTDAWDRFHKLQPTDPAIRVEHVVIMADGPRRTRVPEVLNKAGGDLIVTGTHGRSRLNNLPCGSLTQEAARARCPAMVVKAPGKVAGRLSRVVAKAESGAPHRF